MKLHNAASTTHIRHLPHICPAERYHSLKHTLKPSSNATAARTTHLRHHPPTPYLQGCCTASLSSTCAAQQGFPATQGEMQRQPLTSPASTARLLWCQLELSLCNSTRLSSHPRVSSGPAMAR
eukprot:1158924-Pelagomonas_calceolata.AAC.2